MKIIPLAEAPLLCFKQIGDLLITWLNAVQNCCGSGRIQILDVRGSSSDVLGNNLWRHSCSRIQRGKGSQQSAEVGRVRETKSQVCNSISVSGMPYHSFSLLLSFRECLHNQFYSTLHASTAEATLQCVKVAVSSLKADQVL